jgi:putative addiction module component (TIGR02574 family)
MIDRDAEALAVHLLSWPTADRARLAELLIASLEEQESDVDEAWDDEIAQRIAAFKAGTVRAIPAADVFAEIDRRLAR